MNLRRISDRIRKRFENGGVILVYHRVTRLQRDPQLLAVSPNRFAEHLDVLRRKANVVPLRKFNGEAKADLPTRSVAITFDDGYADNLVEAKPILERMDVPATVFVVSGVLGSTREFWWDDLDRILLQPDDAGWHVEQTAADIQRRVKYIELCTTFKRSSSALRAQMLEKFCHANGCVQSGRPTHRTLTPQELRQLAQGGLVEIGAHTATHPVLSLLPESEQQSEIELSKRRLEDVTEKPVVSFAYPYGGKADYTRQSVACVRKAGYSLACSNFPGIIWPATNRFELPRFLIRDWSGDEFERRLERIVG